MSKLNELFEKYMKCKPSFEELNDLLRAVDPLTEKVYPFWLEKLDDLIASKPKDGEKNILLIRLKDIFRWKEIRREEIAEKLISLDPSDNTYLLVMEILPVFEKDLLLKIQDKKKKLLYLMEKEAKKLRK